MRATCWWFVALVPLLTGCPSNDEACAPRVISSDVECTISQDCVDEGFNTLACINGSCQRACARDADCVLEKLNSEDDCFGEVDPQAETPICEAQICRTGCPTVACGAGESCERGRCAYDFEGFEIPEGQTFVDLMSLGFVAEDVVLTNRTVRIAQVGRFGCTLGDEMCAGAPSAGDRYVVLGTTPTRERGTAGETPPTCRECACCLDCIVNQPVETAVLPANGQRGCPGEPARLWSLPQSLICPATPPAQCVDVCNACDNCPAAPPRVGDTDALGDRLTACEARAATRACANCVTCNASVDGCRASMCATECSNPASAECATCVRDRCFSTAECLDCEVCSQAAECELAMTGTAECAMFRQRCDALGAQGCYATPAHYPRAGLTPAEQSLTSRVVDLSSASGNVVLEFDFVAFNVGILTKVGVEGMPPEAWQDQVQEVVVELCGGNCSEPSSWVEGQLTDGSRAFFPPTSRRDNGLSLGSQSEIDWRGGHVRVTVPDALRTAGFRYRFRPRLSEGARVGIDEIYVRTVQ